MSRPEELEHRETREQSLAEGLTKRWRNGRELAGRASLFDQHRKFIARPLNDAS